MYSCCGDYLVGDKIKKAHCVDGRIIESLFHPEGLNYKAKPTRKECGCTESTDIGTYDTCPHGCVYCYANANKVQRSEAAERHEPDSAFLGYSKAESDRWILEIRKDQANRQSEEGQELLGD
jgi:histone acetyltransferase (RNA polymerase elongator complex component)